VRYSNPLRGQAVVRDTGKSQFPGCSDQRFHPPDPRRGNPETDMSGVDESEVMKMAQHG